MPLIHRITPAREQATTHLVCVPHDEAPDRYLPLAAALGIGYTVWVVTPDDPRCADEIARIVPGAPALYGHTTAAALDLARELPNPVGVFLGAPLPVVVPKSLPCPTHRITTGVDVPVPWPSRCTLSTLPGAGPRPHLDHPHAVAAVIEDRLRHTRILGTQRPSETATGSRP
ncbi:hypothetical protein V5P93_004093 [Actinokineospora auranticolor]|uniref:Uncharacterized protein n=1 Tax=Actinokineospora auranticolor TaxID=155976 RepID=A0A2S6GD42_9PSEU|nr:hypothetical protein [Actinokineospora auranticolor]PPK63158.1 hypothetical protein CLV40_13127 [Actinokineospora auranticolor]